MAIGPNGNLYFSDGADFRIKSYSFASGAITVLAGNGTRGPIETDGSALSSPLSFPRAVAVAPDGTVYFSTLEPAVFRLTRPEGKLEVLNIRVPQAKLPPTDYDMPLTDYDIPSSLALDDKGDLFVAQVNRSRVLRITLQSGEVSVFAGASDRGLSGKSVPASQAAVTAPMYVASDSNGDVTIAERHRIRNIEAANGLIVTVLGGGSPVFSDDSSHAAGFGDLWEPADAVPASDGSVIITSAFSNRLLRLDPQGSLTVLAGGGAYTQVESDPGPADRVALNLPQGIWLDTNGDIYFSDTSNRIVRLLAAGSGWVKNFATTPKGFNSASPYLIHAAALVGDASYFYLSDPDGGCVWRVSRRDGEVELYAGIAPGSLGPARGGGTGRLMAPSGLALDSAGNLYIADADAGRPGRILRVESGTHRIFTVLPDLRQPSGLAFLSPSVLCFSESAGHRVGCLNLQTGTVKTVAGTGRAGFSGDGGPAECAQLNRPSGISFDADGDLYIADTGNQRIRRVHLGTGSAQCHP